MRGLVVVGRRIRMVFDMRVFVVGRWVVLLLGIAGAVGLSPVAVQACSVCGGSAIGTDPGSGFNSSILFLLTMPYAVVGAIAGWLIYSYWRASGNRRERTRMPYVASLEKESEG